MGQTGILYYLASGALFGSAFVIPYAYIAFLPAFILLYIGIERSHTHRALFIGGTLTGTLIYLGSFYWVWSTLPVIWMAGQPIWVQAGAVGLYWILTSLVMGVGCGVFALVIKRIMHTPLLLVTLAPIIWTLSEVLRSFLFSVYSAGEGSLISADFSFGYIGYLLAQHGGLLQFSVFGGAYALSLLATGIGTFGYCVVRYRLYTKRHVQVLGVVLGIVCISTMSDDIHVRSYQEQGLSVISIDTRFDKAFVGDTASQIRQAELRDAFATALTYDPDVILTPEDAKLAQAFTSTDELFTWVKQRTSKDVIIIDNGQAYDARGKFVIRTYIYDTKTESVYFFDKKYLVPQGEFMSYLHLFLIDLVADDATMQSLKESVRAYSGVVEDSSALPAHLPGVLFCFETMVPLSVYRSEAIREHPFIAHSISHSWFIDPDSLEYQLDAMMKVHAVWNDVPLVSAGNMVEGQYYTVEGKIEEGEILQETHYITLRRFSL